MTPTTTPLAFMNWLRRNNCISVLLITVGIILVTSCENKNKPYLKKTADDWEPYLNEISDEEIQAENAVFLVLKTKECEPCINELTWWNEEIPETTNLAVYLIIIERYQTTFNAFLKHNNLNIVAIRDKNGLVLDKELIPHTPVKVYINETGRVKYLEPINIQADPEKFYAKITG